MAFFPITLGVGRSSDAGTGAKDSKSLKNLAEKTLKRDDYVCRFCGFRSLHYQRTIPWPEAGDPPFATACTFCEQCLALERANITGTGLLIWLPEIGQAELNHILRSIYIARASKSDMTDSATRALDVLTARRADAKKRLGSDDPSLLATVMQEMLNRKEKAAAVPKLEGVRLLPPDKHMIRGKTGDVNQFPKMIQYWCSPEGPYGKLPADGWREMFKTALAKVGNA